MKIMKIQGYDPCYEVTNGGVVFSTRYGKRKRLKFGVQRGGYFHVNLWKDGKHRSCKVHQLVLDAFAGKRKEGQVCRHLDGDPQNNRLSNLCWGDMKENAADRGRHGRDPKSRFTVAQLEQMRTMPGLQREVAAKFGVSKSYISAIRLGKRGPRR